MAMGAFIALLRPGILVPPHEEISQAVHIYAGYLFSRNLVLALMLLAALGLRARGMLNTLMLLTAFVQFLDAGVDLMEGRLTVVPGVVIFGTLLLVGSRRLSGHGFWNAKTWR
jgi:hypothetical protein